MLIKTKGIVLRTVKYSETSLICDIYTAEKGLRTYIVSGVRKRKAKTAPSLLQLMSLLDLVVYHRTDKAITRTKEIKAAYVYQDLPFSIVKSAVGMFIIELTRKCIQEEEPNEELFYFLYDTFLFLDKTTTSIAALPLVFLISLSEYLGFRPTQAWDKQTPFFDMREGSFVAVIPPHLDYINKDLSLILGQLLQHTIQDIHLLKISPVDRQNLLDKLLQFYQCHIDGLQTINAPSILKEVL